MILWHCSGSSTSLAKTVSQTHPTLLYVDWDFGREKNLYQGLMDQVETLEEGLRVRPDVVCFESTGNGDLADNLRKWLAVWGGGSLQDELEQNRGWCISLAHQCGLNVPLTIIFDPNGSEWNPGDKQVQVVRGWVNEAIAWMQKQSGRWVLKPYDSDSAATTYVSDGPEDMIDRLKDLMEEHQIPEGSAFLIQQFIPGKEVSTEGWYSNGKMVPGSYNNTIELKKAFSGDLGPTIGSASSTVWFISDDSPLVQATFTPKLRQWLLRPTGPDGKVHPPYHGPLDLNTIISDEDGKPYFLEATPRMGWCAYYALKELLPAQQLGEIFVRAGQGRLSSLPHLGGYGIELTLCIPPFPTTEMVSPAQHMGRVYREILEPATNIAIKSRYLSDPRINWIDVKIDPKTKNLVTAGTFGQIASVSTQNKTVETAAKEIYGLLDEIHIPEKFYRVDGFDRATDYLPWLKKRGFEVPF